MAERAQSCCFTGHRPEKLPWRTNEADPRCTALKQRLFDTVEAVYRCGVTHFICGMARGCDTFFCEAVIELRNEHPEISLEAAIPCEEQAEGWTDAEKKRYDRLVSSCDYITLISHSYTPTCMEKRNHYMVDHASVLIAVYDGSRGGTMSTMLYALRQGLEIIEILPLE